MNVTTTSGHQGSCPTCAAYTMAMPTGRSEYCPSCLTVVTRYRNVRVVQPRGFRQDRVRA